MIQLKNINIKKLTTIIMASSIFSITGCSMDNNESEISLLSSESNSWKTKISNKDYNVIDFDLMLKKGLKIPEEVINKPR